MSTYSLFIIFGQRKESYAGQYLPEALDVADEGTMDENPDWLAERLQHHKENSDFEAVEVVPVNIPLEQVMAILRPDPKPIEGKIVKSE